MKNVEELIRVADERLVKDTEGESYCRSAWRILKPHSKAVVRAEAQAEARSSSSAQAEGRSRISVVFETF